MIPSGILVLLQGLRCPSDLSFAGGGAFVRCESFLQILVPGAGLSSKKFVLGPRLLNNKWLGG